MQKSERRLLKASWLRLLGDIPFTHEITFNFGVTLSMQTASEKMEAFCKRLERRSFGKKWHQKTDGRLTLIAFPENVDTNTHFHGMAKLSRRVERVLARNGSTVWSELTPRGQLHAGPLKNIDAANNYFTKQLRTNDRLDWVYLYVGSRGFCRRFEGKDSTRARKSLLPDQSFHPNNHLLATVRKSTR